MFWDVGIFDEYPYSNVHELNLNWLLKTMKKLGISFNDLEKYVDGKIDELDEYIKEEIEKLNQYLIDNLQQTLQELIQQGYFSIELAYDYDDVNEELIFKLVATEEDGE